MARTLTSGVQTAIAAEVQALVHLIELDFSGGTLYLTTAPVNITATVGYPDGTTASQAFSAIGGTLECGEIAEGVAPGQGGTPLTLGAVDQTVIAALLTSGCLGRPAYVWRCYFDANWAVIASPLLLFTGRMSGDWECSDERPAVIGGTGKATISTRVTDIFGDFEQVRGLQTSLASHQSRPEQTTPATTEAKFATDTFFQFVSVMLWKRFQWGSVIFALDPTLPYQHRGGGATGGQRTPR